MVVVARIYTEFSEAKKENISLLVAPPRLGGKEKKGVFATRAPFRPNSIGLSSVKLEEIYYDDKRGKVFDVLKQDPRAAYNKKLDFVYGMSFAEFDIRFIIKKDTLIVKDVVEKNSTKYKKVKSPAVEKSKLVWMKSSAFGFR